MPFLTRLLLPLVLLLGLLGCSSESEVEPTNVALNVTASAPAEPREETVALGSLVTLSVTSEVDGLIHVHGFEETIDLVPGETAEVTFKASMTGAFDVETHEPDAVWIKLVVS
ncbi:MAG: hypothetical protein ACTHU1_07140 [Arachnia sp.]